APGGGVTSVSRVGIRIYLSVGSGGAAVTAFAVDSLTAQRDADGRPFVTAQVHNTGERAVDLSGRLELSNGPSSLSAGPFTVSDIATLAVGESGPVTVVLDPALPNGPWDATITLESGKTSQTVTGSLTFPTENGTSASPTTDLDGGGRSPMIVVFAVAIVALGLLVLSVAVRRRRPADHVVATTPSGGPSERP
ncbi:MAG: hypothetical protein QOD63_774, partial [Actinomycetota bacterium]|nr:hypothetical protein [Actinomycetota bacterium]